MGPRVVCFQRPLMRRAHWSLSSFHHYLCIRKDCTFCLTPLSITGHTESAGGYPKSFLPLIKYDVPPELTFCDPLFNLALASCVTDTLLSSVLGILLQLIEKSGASSSPAIPRVPPFAPFPTVFLSTKSFSNFQKEEGQAYDK